MSPAESLAAIPEYLAKVEDHAELVRDAGLRMDLSGGRLRLRGLAEALADLDAAVTRLRRLLARLPDGGAPETAEVEDDVAGAAAATERGVSRG
jgi:hypothetical protein